MSEHSQHVKAYFDQPARYLKRRFNVAVRAEIVKDLVGELVSCNLLDIGCGNGAISRQFLAPTNKLTLMDLSSEMLTIARQETPQQLQSNVTYLQQDFQTWKPDRLYDVVLCIGVLAHVSDIQGVFNKLEEVTKPGGQCIVQFTDQGAILAKTQRVIKSINGYLRSRFGYGFNYLSYQQTLAIINKSSFRLTDHRRYSLLMPGMGKLPDSFLYQYEKFTLRNRLVSKLGTEVIIKLTKAAD